MREVGNTIRCAFRNCFIPTWTGFPAAVCLRLGNGSIAQRHPEPIALVDSHDTPLGKMFTVRYEWSQEQEVKDNLLQIGSLYTSTKVLPREPRYMPSKHRHRRLGSFCGHVRKLAITKHTRHPIRGRGARAMVRCSLALSSALKKGVCINEVVVDSLVRPGTLPAEDKRLELVRFHGNSFDELDLRTERRGTYGPGQSNLRR